MGWIRNRTIGKGSHGTVSLAVPVPSSPASRHPISRFAVKSCESSNSHFLVNEKKVLAELGNSHPHIIQFLGDSSSCEGGTHLYNLFLEYAPFGSLSDQVKMLGIGSSDVRRYVRGILHGLCYVHERGYVHGDVKLDNVLLFSDGVVKISDFGLCKRIDDDDVGQFRGTPLYMSPEMVAGGEVGPPADIWALGCAVVEMLSGSPVWRISPESDVSGLLYRIGVAGESPVLPEGFGCDGSDFVVKCFIRDPNERWTARMLLSHPFLSGLSDPCCGGGDGASVSPRSPFEFPELESGLGLGSSVVGSLDQCGYSGRVESRDWSSILRRFEEGLVNDRVRPDWDDSDGWVHVR